MACFLYSEPSNIQYSRGAITCLVVKELTNHSISGSDLFDDSENFMVELDDAEQVTGGVCKGTSFVGTGPICTAANGGWGGATCGDTKSSH